MPKAEPRRIARQWRRTSRTNKSRTSRRKRRRGGREVGRRRRWWWKRSKRSGFNQELDKKYTIA